MTVRILVTGCRDWTDERAIDHALTEILDKDEPFTIVYGACPTGADELARIWGTALDLREVVTLEPHPADWKNLGKGAGPARNQLMAEAGADLALAFWDGVSAGTHDMIARAVRYGIPVRIIPKARRV